MTACGNACRAFPKQLASYFALSSRNDAGTAGSGYRVDSAHSGDINTLRAFVEVGEADA